MNRRSLGTMLLLLASLLCLIVPAAALDTNVRIVRLSYISGDVQLDRGQGEGYEPAIMNMPIVQGSRLWTRGEDALAEVEFEDGSTLRLTPGTAVEFQELSLRGSGEKVSSVQLESGTAYFDIRNHMGDFRVTLGGQEISVTRPARFRLFGDNSHFKVAVYRGEVAAYTGDNQVEVCSGETLALDLSDRSHYNLAKSIAEGSYDDWNHERERYQQSYTAPSTYSADSYYNFSPAYSYGLADLAYYGNYFYAPGWGWMWRPYYTGVWNPFMDGAWVWYPQFGYMWVSSYPWGWMPFRYGAWNFVPGYGWCWMPARTWNRWVPVTVVNRQPVNWVAVRPPATPPKAGSPGVVTVGRAWGVAYPPGATRTSVPGNTILPAGGNRAPIDNRVFWGAARANTPSGVTTKSTVAPASPPTPATPTAAPPAARPARSAPARVHRDSEAPRPRAMPESKPSAPAAPRSQLAPSPAGSHSWSSGRAVAPSGGGHGSGAWGSHGASHR